MRRSFALVCLVASGDALTTHATMVRGRSLRRHSLRLPPKVVLLCDEDRSDGGSCCAGDGSCCGGSLETAAQQAAGAGDGGSPGWSAEMPGELDMGLLREWMATALQSPGARIAGAAGVLSIHCAERRFVLRGAHLHSADLADLEGEFADEWGEGEARESRLVLLGSGLDGAALRHGLAACVASPAATQRKLDALRFAVGDAVECLTQSGWCNATVVERLWRDDGMPPGVVAPYQLRLDDGGGGDRRIFAPEDSKDVVRATALARLRFAVGEAVECNLGERWAKGVVVDLMYREAGMASGGVAPYQVELEGGGRIYAPSDVEEVVRRPRPPRTFDPLSLLRGRR